MAQADLPNVSGLTVERTQDGKGSTLVKRGDKLQIHYRGTLAKDGSKFDASYDRNSPFDVTIGIGQVIKGWDEGLIGMKVGEKRKLTISPELGYGAQGAGNVIPPHATLIFDTELLKINGKTEKDEL